MTEEEFFINNYPDSCYGDRPLSPHWDFFQDGVEFGERKSKKRIEELEESLDKLQKSTFNMIDEKNNHIAELEKENAELKCECRRCVYTDCPCVLSDYGKDKNGICDHLKDVFDENTELREINKMLEQGYVWHDYDAGEDCYEDSHEGKWVKRDEVYQLTKAKKIIKTLLRLWNDVMTEETVKALIAEAEQFLNEVEK